MRHVVNQRVHFTGEVPHNGEGGHVQGNSSARFEPCLVQLSSAANHIAGSIGCLNNDCKNKNVLSFKVVE